MSSKKVIREPEEHLSFDKLPIACVGADTVGAQTEDGHGDNELVIGEYPMPPHSAAVGVRNTNSVTIDFGAKSEVGAGMLSAEETARKSRISNAISK